MDLGFGMELKGIVMLGNGNSAKQMGKESTFGLMEIDMKENSNNV